jgi:hypothetical protein
VLRWLDTVRRPPGLLKRSLVVCSYRYGVIEVVVGKLSVLDHVEERKEEEEEMRPRRLKNATKAMPLRLVPQRRCHEG